MTTNTVTKTASKDYDLLSTNEYTFTYDDGTTAPLSYAIDGNNLVATAKVEYIAEADVSGSLWGFNVPETTEHPNYTFKLVKYNKAGQDYPVDSLDGKYLWQSEQSYGTVNNKPRYWLLDNSVFSKDGSVYKATESEAVATNFKIYQYINGKKGADVTAEFVDASIAHKLDTTYYDTNAAGLYNIQGEYTYTFNNFVKESETSSLVINDIVMNQKDWTVEANDDDDFIGTRLNEVAKSKSADETFNLGTGKDEITFEGDYGNDTVILNKGETLSLALKNEYYDYDIDKNDVVISQDKVEYIAEADVSGSLWGNTVPANTKYTFKLVEYKKDGQDFPEESLDGKYLWQSEQSYGTVNNKPRYWLLDNSVFSKEGNVYKATESGATATNFKIYEYINGKKGADVTAAFVDDSIAHKGDATYYDTNAIDLFNSQNLNYGTITIKDFAKEENGILKINGDKARFEFWAERDKKGVFAGTRFNDTAISTDKKDTFDLKAGYDTVDLYGNFGDDTVKLSKDETAVLNYNWVNKFNAAVTSAEDLVVSEIKGSNLVLKTDVQYVATIKVNNNLLYDGYLAKIKDGKYDSANEAVEAKGTIDITNKLSDVKYAKGDDVITKAQYDKLSATAKKDYVFKEGTLKLTLQTHIAHGSETAYNAYRFATDALYQLDKNWRTNKPIERATNCVAEDLTADVHFQFTATDLASFLGENATGTFYDEQPADKFQHKVSDLHIYEVINGNEREITDKYMDDVDGMKGSALSDYNKNLMENQLSGSVTVANYTKKDSSSKLQLSLNDVESSTTFTYQIESKKDVFTGTAANDVAVSTKENETFNLKTGSDKITFKGMFGDDTVKLTKGEILNLDFDTDTANIVTEIEGNNLKLSTKVEYIAEADVSGSLWGFNVPETTEHPNYTFKLVEYDKTVQDYPVEALNGKYLWKADQSYGTVNNKPRYWMLDNSVFSKEGNVYKATESGGTATNFKIYEYINGVKGDDVTAAFVDDSIAHKGDATYYDTNATALFNKQISGTVTVENFTKDTGATLAINSSPYSYQNTINANNLETAVVKGKITGTSVKDVIDASSYVSANGVKGLTINTGSGFDNVTGTSFNDNVTVKSLEGQTATVTEVNGTNKVNFGKGNDVFTASEDGYSSNTVNMGLGDNRATLSSLGTNKLTAGNGSNNVTVNNGVNTIKLGNATTAYNDIYAHNRIVLNDGLNKVTTGKGVDNFVITDGNNTINSGAGKDTFSIAGGYNVIKTGAGDKDFTAVDLNHTSYGITGGTNNITTGKGNDKFLVVGGNNTINAGAGNDIFNVEAAADTINTLTGGAGDDKFIVTANAALTGLNITLDGGAGNDIYDLSEFDYENNQINIVDKKADKKVGNTVILNEKETVIFDVALKTDKNGNAIIKKNKNNNVTSYTTSNTLIFTADDNLANGVDTTKGVKFETAKNVKLNVQYGTTENSINYSNIATIAQNVADWLADSTKNTAGYTSAFEAFNSGTDVTTLAACYTNSTGAYNV